MRRQGAKVMIIEEHYVDRHFMEEIGQYYSRCLKPPPNYCRRVHFFSEELGLLTEEDFFRFLFSPATSAQDVTARLQQHYLGFVVVRPIPAAPIGRTILKLPREAQYDCRAFSEYSVYVLGYRLTVKGLPYQQQDAAVAVCAATAMWSALQRVARRDGNRGPTPAETAVLSVKHLVPFGRPFPSAGLSIEQMCDGLRECGYPPILFALDGVEGIPQALLMTYLRSGMPVILTITGVDEAGTSFGHAVVVLGSAVAQTEIATSSTDEVELSFVYSNRVVVHDDSIGPYLDGEILTLDRVPMPHRQKLADAFGIEPSEYALVPCLKTSSVNAPPDYVVVRYGVVPMYPKQRSSALELFYHASELGEACASLLKQPLQFEKVECRFRRAGRYVESINASDYRGAELPEFQRTVVLSRYVGVTTLSWKGQKLIDGIWDCTDIRRDVAGANALLGVVGHSELGSQLAQALGAVLSVPSC